MLSLSRGGPGGRGGGSEAATNPMTIPTTTGAVIVLLAILPGFVGDYIYRSFTRVDWREKDWRSVLRLLGFSVVGAALYSLVAELFHWPAPIHLIPASYTTLDPSGATLNRLFIVYIGHLMGGAVAGGLLVLGEVIRKKIPQASAHSNAWDDFTGEYALSHWVVVGLQNRSIYAGILESVDDSVAAEERDLVLREPALYDPESQQYESSNFQHLFIAANTVYSIATIYDPKIDKRLFNPGELLFEQKVDDEPG